MKVKNRNGIGHLIGMRAAYRAPPFLGGYAQMGEPVGAPREQWLQYIDWKCEWIRAITEEIERRREYDGSNQD